MNTDDNDDDDDYNDDDDNDNDDNDNDDDNDYYDDYNDDDGRVWRARQDPRAPWVPLDQLAGRGRLAAGAARGTGGSCPQVGTVQYSTIQYTTMYNFAKAFYDYIILSVW